MSTKLARGLVVGGYELDFRLGVGGMGEVWAAKKADGSRVAVKLLRTDLDPADHQLFVDEARTALVLDHPHIVRTWDVGEAEALGYFYIVMELISGPSISVMLQACQQQGVKVPAELVAAIGRQIAQALHYAHVEAQVGGRFLHLIHRDITPHNILLDPKGRALLTDFGVARTDVQEHRTQTGTIRGKPAYMAPEQVSQERIDQRTDLFSLGIVLYEMATMRRLFGRANMILSIRAVVEEEPVPIPELVPGFPEPLWQLIKEMLEKRIARRVGSAAEVAARLAVLDAAPVGTSRSGPGLAAFLGWLYPAGSFDAERASHHEATQSTTTAPDLSAAREEQGPDEALTELDRKEQTRSWPVFDRSGTFDLPPARPLELRDMLDTMVPPAAGTPAPAPPGPSSRDAGVRPSAGLWLAALLGAGLVGLAGAGWLAGRRAEPEIPQVPLLTRSVVPPPTTSTTATSTRTP